MRGACSVAQSYQTLCNPMDCSPTGSSVHGLFQARILEWVAISYPGDLPKPGRKLSSLVSPALAGRFLPLRHLGSPALLYGCFLTFLKTFKISTSLHSPATWKGFLHLVNSHLLFQAHLTPRMAMPTQLTPVTSVLRTSFFHPAPQSQSETGCLVTLHPWL